ncbi:MAG: PQQ-binding-like beta-propeller repeat protein [Planctomycetota bacterium]
MTGYRWMSLAVTGLALLDAGPLAEGATRQASEAEGTAKVTGWLDWRGPEQNGSSRETGLIETVTIGGENHLWSYDLSGRGAPVIANGRLYCLGYSGANANLREHIACLDAETGELIWEDRFTDFLNDSIYSRYAIGSPVVDPETEKIYFQTSAGILWCYSKDGERLWQHSMMELNGRLTFPNGRVGAPVLDEDLVIVHAITSNWGPEGPARDRFYAFDKSTGEEVWACTPGVPPKDSSFSRPFLETRDGRRVLYAGTGCGNLVCIDVRTGDPLWRFQMSLGGVNSSPVVWNDRVVCIHGKENLDTSEAGRMVAIQAGATPPAGEAGPVVLGAEAELWRNHLHIFTSSPVLAGDRVYQTIHTGELCAVDVTSGKILWEEKFGTDQIHASPLWADGKLYVPMNDGGFHIVRPTDEKPERLCSVELEGACLGAPSVCAGRIYVHTTEKLYCFGKGDPGPIPAVASADERPAAGEATRLQIVPSNVQLSPGESVTLRARSLDANGRVSERGVGGLEWAATEGVSVVASDDGLTLTVSADSKLGTATLGASKGDLKGRVRLRVQPTVPFVDDFDSYALTVPHYAEEGVKFQFPPSYWLSSKPKWEIREFEGTQVLAKRLDNMLFQRSMMMIGQPEMSTYTAQVDICTDGTRRMKSSAGIVNQRYLITLKGNAQSLEITSNFERIRESVKFSWKAKKWYTLKTRVDVQADGTTSVVRAKCWPRDEEEPAAWTIEYTHANGHRNGAVGLFGYAPQARFRVYMDNFKVEPSSPLSD